MKHVDAAPFDGARSADLHFTGDLLQRDSPASTKDLKRLPRKSQRRQTAPPQSYRQTMLAERWRLRLILAQLGQYFADHFGAGVCQTTTEQLSGLRQNVPTHCRPPMVPRISDQHQQS